MSENKRMRKGARVSACLLLWEKRRRRRGERERWQRINGLKAPHHL